MYVHTYICIVAFLEKYELRGVRITYYLYIYIYVYMIHVSEGYGFLKVILEGQHHIGAVASQCIIGQAARGSFGRSEKRISTGSSK